MDFDWIENNILLHTLDEGEKKLLSRVFEVIEFDIGDKLITQGHTEKDMFIIRDGMAAVTYSHEGKEVHVGFAEPGGIVGGMSLFRENPASATVSAMSPILAYKIAHQSYCKLLAGNSDMLVSLLAYIQHSTSQALANSNLQLASVLKGLGDR